MAQVSEKSLNQMLKHIADPKIRNKLANVISGKATHKVYCLRPAKEQDAPENAKHTTTDPIALIYSNGNILPIENKGHVFLRSYRDRLDGARGFSCWCGNDSIKAEEEKGLIGASTPSKETLEQVFEKVSDKEPYPVKNGVQEVDGFKIEKVLNHGD